MKPVLELVAPAVKLKIGLKYRIITIKWLLETSSCKKITLTYTLNVLVTSLLILIYELLSQ